MNRSLVLIAGLATLLILLGLSYFREAAPSVATSAPQLAVLPAATTAPGPNPLQGYLQQIEGLWVNEGYARGVAAGEILQEREADFSVEIDAQKILGDQALIVVSEYCRPGLAQYLHFRLVDQHLEMVGASVDGCYFDMPRIDFMEIRYQVEAGDTVLVYEARETEYEHYQSERLVKARGTLAQPGQFHCGLQAYLGAMLRQGNFELYDAEGQLLAPQEVFGSAYGEELSYLEAFSYFWPGYEELCVRADFEVVVIGGAHPTANIDIYAIEWDVREIRLYETRVADYSEDGAFPLEKGALRYHIVPSQVQAAPDM